VTALDASGLSCDEAGALLLEPSTYADDELVQRLTTQLREESPIQRVEHPDYPPLWLLTRHRDIKRVELAHHQMLQGTGFLEPHAQGAAYEDMGVPKLKMLIHMDGDEHRLYRSMTSSWFTPRNLSRLQARIAELAGQTVERMAATDGTCDFATDVAMPFPLQVILSMLGLPEADYPLMLKLTQQMLGSNDPEYSSDVLTPAQLMDSIAAFVDYFNGVTADRQANPTDDLASVIANAQLPDGAPIPLDRSIGYYTIFAVAGHDTTSAALAGGLQALIEHPDQLGRLQEHPDLMGPAVDELIRWVTPVKHFIRTASVPFDVGGQSLYRGEIVFMSYPAANRDPEVFVDPMDLDIARSPNDHLAFGIGAHYCLGAQLAKMELRSVLGQLLPRLRSVELAGKPELMRALMVGGLKHLPIHFEMA
jgi:hypothetical protein